MTIDKLIKLLLFKKIKSEMIAVLKSVELPSPDEGTKREIERRRKSRVQTLGKHLTMGRRREALAIILVLMIADAEFTISEIRRTGLLRISRYDYHAPLITDIVATILQNRMLLNVKNNHVIYLESVLAITRLAPNVRKIHDDIKQFLRSRKNEVIKTLLVMVNQSFYLEYTADVEINSSGEMHTSPEDVSEAVSFLLSTYRKIFKLTDESCNKVDENAIKSNNPIYNIMLYNAMLVCKYRDVECLIDGLPYQACVEGRIVRVSSIDAEIEKSVRLGYIQSQKQLLIRAMRLSRSDAPPSIKDLVESGFGKGIENSIEIVDFPVRRLTFKTLATPETFGLFSRNHLLKEEVESLLALDIENYEDVEKTEYKITENISSMDIFKLQRYFRFLSCLYQRKLKEFSNKEERTLLTFRSNVFIVPKHSLLNQINLIFSDQKKTNDLIDLLTLDENRTFVDLQYTPFIAIGSHYVIAPHIIAVSNIVRNIVCANNLHNKISSGKIDPMQKSVVNALESAGFKVHPEAKPRIDGKELEIDIVAWRDDILFLFECKNAYHPCSTHEMRNSFEHIDKARCQLDIRLETFKKQNNQLSLFKKLNWDLPTTNNIYTGIIIANRVFHGSQLSGHPIRQAHELINVILRGEIKGYEEKMSFWKGPDFQIGDLVSYLKGETIIADQMSALESYQQKFRFGPRSLELLTYRMDDDVLAEKTRARCRIASGDLSS